MTIDIKPLASAGQIKLGLTKQEVYEKIGKPTDSFPEKDCYQSNDIFFSVSYDQNDKVEYIEYSKTGNKDFSIRIHDIDIFWTPADQLINHVKSVTKCDFDSEDFEIPYSYIFPDLELSFWRPTIPSDYEENEVEDEYENGKYFRTIGIGIKGYYSEMKLK